MERFFIVKYICIMCLFCYVGVKYGLIMVSGHKIVPIIKDQSTVKHDIMNQRMFIPENK